MTEIKDGGPIFPTVTTERFEDAESGIGGSRQVSWRGLTKREWFAGLAMQAMLTNPTTRMREGFTGSHEDGIAQTAFVIAQAMLKEGEKK